MSRPFYNILKQESYTLDEIKNILLSIQPRSSIKTNFLSKLLVKNDLLKNFIDENIDVRTIAYCILYGLKIEHRYCPECGKEIFVKNLKDGYPKTCSVKCMSSFNLKARTQTNIEKYGSASPFGSELVKNKIKQTNLKNYGVDNPSKSKIISKKNQDKLLDKSFKELSKLDVLPLFSRSEWKGHNKREDIAPYKWKCKVCGHEFTSNINGIWHPICRKCHPISISKGQEELINFLKDELNQEVEVNNRHIIKPYELDIVIPSKKIAMEYNGVYFHSSYPKDYHVMKTELCEALGYKLIHVFENEWNCKKEIVKNRLRNILGLNKTIYARKCTIKEISTKDKDYFLEQNHIQGKDISKVKLGLFYKDQLVGVMTFGKPRFNKNYEWELIRFASIGRIVGGASKLLHYFLKNYFPKSIVTYADRKWSHGKLYRALGFTFVGKTEPSYFYSNGKQVLSRYECQKHKLKKILGEKFDPTLTELENMTKAFFQRVYDCGNLVFELNLK